MPALPATSVKLDPSLTDAARRAAGLPADTGITALIRYALARLAGWPEDAARAVGRIQGGGAGA